MSSVFWRIQFNIAAYRVVSVELVESEYRYDTTKVLSLVKN